MTVHSRRQDRARSRPVTGVLLLGLMALLGSPATGGAEAVEVVASIQPVHSLVAGVMGEVAEPVLMVRGYGSPHAHQLRPTVARAIGRARVVFWIGPGLESFLVGVLERRGDGATVVALGDTPGLVRHRARAGGVWEPGAHDADHGHGSAGWTDMHLWLDVGNAERMVDAIASALARADPGRDATYRRHADILRRRLAVLDAELESLLAPVRHQPFVVLHDAYQYLERRYGLDGVGTVLVSPDRAPSAKRLRELRARVRETGARCVFREPQFESALVDVLVEGTEVRVGILDPLGSGAEPGPDAYFEMMRANARAIAACLGEDRSRNANASAARP